MSKLLTTTPKQDGFYMPIESTQHCSTWMLWPHMKDNWHDDRKPARATFAKIANAISKYEPVKMIINHEDSTEAWAMLDENVILVEIKHFDSWARDMGPLYVINKQGERRAVNFQFNGWGMQNVPEINTPDFKWDYTIDDQVSKVISENSDVDYYQAPMVLEGGSIHQDGDGTIYTTEECLLNPNRNPHLTKTQIEEYLKQYLNAEKVIWIPRGVYNDETSGHVDNLMHVIAPGHVILSWTDDQNDPQYERSLEALTVFRK